MVGKPELHTHKFVSKQSRGHFESEESELNLLLYMHLFVKVMDVSREILRDGIFIDLFCTFSAAGCGVCMH